MRSRVLTIAFIAWVILWVMFNTRELFVKRQIVEYGALLTRPLDAKRSFVTGDRFYELLTRAADVMPEKASYTLVGPDGGALERRRAVYYLYPHLESPSGDYQIFYRMPGAEHALPGYAEVIRLDDDRMILRKVAS